MSLCVISSSYCVFFVLIHFWCFFFFFIVLQQWNHHKSLEIFLTWKKMTFHWESETFLCSISWSYSEYFSRALLNFKNLCMKPPFSCWFVQRSLMKKKPDFILLVLWPKISKNGKYVGPDFNYQIPSIAAMKQRLRHRVPSSLLSTAR